MNTWNRFFFLFILAYLFSVCNPLQAGSIPSSVTTQQHVPTSTEISEESLIATEQAMVGTAHAEFALTLAAQPTFTPQPTLASILAHLPTLTPIPNSAPAQIGAFFDVPPNVLGARYEIENACYFDTQSGWERYEIYAGAIAGSGDEYSAQGVVVVRILRVVEQGGKPFVELANIKEYFTLKKMGPLRIPQWGDCDDRIFLTTSLNFGWFLNPVNEEFFQENSIVPLARMEIDGNLQIAETGSYCWKGGCADGPAISTSSMPLVMQSPMTVHLYLPLQEPPDVLQLHAMFVSPPSALQGAVSYDYIGEDNATWSYEKPGRGQLDLGSLPLRREQEIKFSLEPGFYVLTLLAVWHDYGDVMYGFLIEVQ